MNYKNIRKACCAAAFAAAVLLPAGCARAEEEKNAVKQIPAAGIVFEIPDEFEQAAGAFEYEGFEINYGDGVYYAAIWYFAMSQEELDECLRLNYVDQETQKRLQAQLPLAYLFGIDGGRGEEQLNDYLVTVGLEAVDLEELGNIGEYRYYLYPLDDFFTQEAAKEILGSSAEEYLALRADRELLREHLSFTEPEDKYDFLTGRVLEFETSDLDGNTVSAPEIFAEHKITMINCWTSWCGFCIDEMPELQKLSKTLEEKDCALISILFDGEEETAVNTARKILSDSSADFPVLMPWDGLTDLLPVEGYPTTFFVDGSGRLIGRPIIGARIDRYEPSLDALLEEMQE